MSSNEAASGGEPPRLAHFPISIFGVCMGGFGLALAFRAGGVEPASLAVGWLTFALFAVFAGIYALKAVRHPAALHAEWSHPVRLAFFPATSISLLLFAAFLHPDLPALANAVWIVGAAAQALLTLVVASVWISHRNFGPGHLSPAWFIPAVGNIVAPLAGVPLGYVELCWYFFSVGAVFWLVLLTLVFNRLIFHDPMPGRLRPTLVILVAPPAVGFLSWMLLHGGIVDDTARVLLNIGYFFTALVAIQIRALMKLPFALSFWALSFPLAAITSASFRFADLTHTDFHRWLGWALLVVLVATVAGLVVRTVRAALADEICVPE